MYSVKYSINSLSEFPFLQKCLKTTKTDRLNAASEHASVSFLSTLVRSIKSTWLWLSVHPLRHCRCIFTASVSKGQINKDTPNAWLSFAFSVGDICQKPKHWLLFHCESFTLPIWASIFSRLLQSESLQQLLHIYFPNYNHPLCLGNVGKNPALYDSNTNWAKDFDSKL